MSIGEVDWTFRMLLSLLFIEFKMPHKILKMAWRCMRYTVIFFRPTLCICFWKIYTTLIFHVLGRLSLTFFSLFRVDVLSICILCDFAIASLILWHLNRLGIGLETNKSWFLNLRKMWFKFYMEKEDDEHTAESVGSNSSQNQVFFWAFLLASAFLSWIKFIFWIIARA